MLCISLPGTLFTQALVICAMHALSFAAYTAAQSPLLPCVSSNSLACQRCCYDCPLVDLGCSQVVEEYLEDYNSTSSAPMRLVMFLDAVEHVSRVSRVIRLPRGHALLLGVGGSGRQSLTRLAAHMQDFDVYQIEISKG